MDDLVEVKIVKSKRVSESDVVTLLANPAAVEDLFFVKPLRGLSSRGGSGATTTNINGVLRVVVECNTHWELSVTEAGALIEADKNRIKTIIMVASAARELRKQIERLYEKYGTNPVCRLNFDKTLNYAGVPFPFNWSNKVSALDVVRTLNRENNIRLFKNKLAYLPQNYPLLLSNNFYITVENFMQYDSRNVGFCHACDKLTLLNTSGVRVLDNPSHGVLCSACSVRYAVRRCENCGDEYIIADLSETYGNGYVCSNCIDNYARCEDCGCYVNDDDVEYDCDTNEYVCPNCYAERMASDSEIHEYSYKPRAHLKNDTEKEAKPDMYFGMEIEVSGSQRYAREFTKCFDKNSLYLKSDCSIVNGGFEIVTHPMTFEYWKKKFRSSLSQGLAELRKHNFRGHNYGGIHIHVTRSAIDYDTWCKMVTMFSNDANKKAWLILTQRKEDRLQEWARLKPYTHGDLESMIKDVYRKNSYQEGCNLNSTRYSCLNCTRNTIEFRVFNSNLRIERVMKNLDIVHAMISFASNPRRTNVSMEKFTEYIRKHRDLYPDLNNFMDEKQWGQLMANDFRSTVAPDVSVAEV